MIGRWLWMTSWTASALNCELNFLRVDDAAMSLILSHQETVHHP